MSGLLSWRFSISEYPTIGILGARQKTTALRKQTNPVVGADARESALFSLEPNPQPGCRLSLRRYPGS
jgi:hypothetical protein